MAIEASFAKELSRLQDSDHGFLALFGNNENLDPSLLNIKNGIGLARKSFGSNSLFAAFVMKSSAPD
jgi:hypothetical protein